MFFVEDYYYEERIKDFKLNFDALPQYIHGKNLRSVSQSVWNKIRKEIVEENNYKCSICGATPNTDLDKKNYHVHEIWDIDDKNCILNLVGTELICNKCHDVKHIGRVKLLISKGTYPREYLDDLITHVAKVNKSNDEDVIYSLKKFDHEFNTKINTLKKNKELGNKKWTYTIYKELPFYDNMMNILIKKGLIKKD